MKARVRELIHAQPFQPFIIRLADGREYRVEHPEFVLATKSDATQVVLEELDGRMHFLSARLITSVELAPQNAA